MAPATDALILYAPSPIAMSAATNHPTGTTFITLSLGHSRNAIELLVPIAAPPAHDAADLRAQQNDGYLARDEEMELSMPKPVVPLSMP
jgi:hypothetical protein